MDCSHVLARTANAERFMAWRTVDGENIAPKGAPELETLINGVFNKTSLLSMLRGFIVFENTGSDRLKDCWLSLFSCCA